MEACHTAIYTPMGLVAIGTGAEQPWDQPGQAPALSWIAGSSPDPTMHKHEHFSWPPCHRPSHPFKHSGGLYSTLITTREKARKHRGREFDL